MNLFRGKIQADQVFPFPEGKNSFEIILFKLFSGTLERFMPMVERPK